MPAIRNLIRQFFNSFDLFSCYAATLFVHLSNTLHNTPPNLIDWENEDEVVTALGQWHIDDSYELNACRCFYRMPRIS